MNRHIHYMFCPEPGANIIKHTPNVSDSLVSHEVFEVLSGTKQRTVDCTNW